MAATVTPSSLSTAIQEALNRLRQLNTLDIQSQWQICQQDFELAHSPASKPNTTASWPTATLNDRQHIAWDRGLHVLWLYQAITVPSNLFGYPLAGLTLRLALTWWAEDAQIYVDGTLMQSGDLFECFTRLCLSEKVTPGQVFQIAIRLVSPGHDDGALVRSQLIYELPANHSTPEPSFVADELTVLATLEPDSQQAIEHAIAQLQWDTLTSQTEKDSTDPVLNLWQTLSTEQTFSPASTHPFQQSLSQLRRALKHLSPKLKARTVQCIGHAHLDMAWLWPIADTWEAAERTFNSILNLQKDFPELTYTHSSPALFEWLEHNRPELFKQIQQKVAEGSWSIDAGLWIEPEFNVISGEAIARQILYGQRYCQEKFGTLSTVAWLPDSFGFCWQLPQLLTQGGVQTFATLKLSWNDTTQFPHQLFWWHSPDGSRILSLMLPPIGTDIDPEKMSAYATQWEASTGSTDTLWLPGLGDHGGGPTRDMLEKSQRWQASPFFPTFSFTSAQNYIDQLPVAELSDDIKSNDRSAQSMTADTSALPVWDTDLYLELHRGCYTTHADQKRYNRRSEDLLYQAEVFATIAQITAHQPYPKAAMDTAWKKLLFNQFHDILPGTAIPEVFVDADRDWVEVKKIGDRILKESLDAIALTIPPPPPPHPDATPLLIFNALSWQRSAVVTLTITGSSTTQPSADWKIYDSKNVEVLHQKRDSTQSAAASSKLSFLAKNLPAVGYQCFWLCPGQAHTAPSTLTHHTLENEFLVATINPKTGQIDSLIEKSTRRETFRAPGNQLQAFQDKGQYWDAWNIAPDYADHPLPAPIVKSVEWLENGPIRQQLCITYTLNQSTIKQTYLLDASTPYLKVDNRIDWQETQVLLKAMFPLTVSSDVATYEIPFGAITRPTEPKTEAEKAQWEVPALRWADLSQTQNSSTFGTSILTDCKHGFDAGPSYLRLSLLKSPIWPDPNADKGNHRFSYAIYPHTNSWTTAHTVRHARELNIAPIVHWYKAPTTTSEVADSSLTQSFLAINNSNLVLSAFKPSEDNPNEFVIRCYEAHGHSADMQIENTLELTGFIPTDLLENDISTPEANDIKPCQVRTYRIQTAND